jgi:hypothetical protein
MDYQLQLPKDTALMGAKAEVVGVKVNSTVDQEA